MNNQNLIGCCGFYCGSCPTYAKGQCAGCREAHKNGGCFTASCVSSKGIDYCGLCDEFPCEDIIKRDKATVLDKDWLVWKKRQRQQAE